MEKHRKHHFYDEVGEYTCVITVMLPTGEYGAYRDSEDEGEIHGFGCTRIGAIADLNVWLEGRS